MNRLREGLRRLDSWLFPPAPASVQADLQRMQVRRLTEQVPLLHAVAMFNVGIVIWLAIYDGASALVIGLLAILPAFNFWRLLTWERLRRAPVATEDLQTVINRANLSVVAGLGLASALSVYTFWAGVFSVPAVVPISLTYGTMCVAHSLAPLRKASTLALFAGMVPSAIVMFMSNDMLSKMLAISALSVAVLLTIFLRDHFRSMVEGLMLELRVREQAIRDPLTGLLNRRGFDTELDRLMQDGPVLLGLVDLDEFKTANDHYGHAGGDAVLITCASRLTEIVPGNGIVGRHGGDEFAFALPLPRDGAALSATAQGHLEHLCKPFDFGGKRIPISASVGVAVSPLHADNAPALFSAADMALYRAKEEGKERIFLAGQDIALAVLDRPGKLRRLRA